MIEDTTLVAVLQLLSDGVERPWQQCLAQLRVARAALDAQTQRMLADHGVVISPVVVSPVVVAPVLSSSFLSSRGDDDDAALVIPGGSDRLDADVVLAGLGGATRAGVRELRVLWSTDSTNLRLLERARGEDIDGCALAAEHQSAGRGRRGRHWLSPVACNLYLSIGARLAVPEQMQALSLIVGVAVADALLHLGYAGIGLKWPNDLQAQGRKLAGILIESSGVTAQGITAVIGIGVNVRVPAYVGAQIDQPWIDLHEIAPRRHGRNTLCAAVLGAVTDALAAVRSGVGGRYLARFGDHDVLRDRPVTVRSVDREEHGIARGIDARGELLVEQTAGTRPVSAGEVSVRAG